MADNNYIEKIVSHIKDKNKKEASAAELTDHYIERQKWYEDSGFDEDIAAEKAEEDIGDPDVIGEQLAADTGKHKQDWLFMPFAIAFMIYRFVLEKYTVEWFSLDYFLNFAMTITLLILFIRSLAKRIPLTAAASCIMMFLIKPTYFIGNLASLIGGTDVTSEFFMPVPLYADGRLPMYSLNPISSALALAYSDKAEKISTVLSVIFCAIIVFGMVSAVVISIRVRKFKNTLADYKTAIAVKWIFTAVIIITVLTVGIQTVKILTFESSYQSSAASELAQINSQIFKEIELYHSDKDNYEKNADYYNNTEKYLSEGTYTHKNIVPAYFAQSFTRELNGFSGRKLRLCSREFGEKVVRFAKSGKFLEDAPSPYWIVYDYQHDKLTAIYDCDYYGVMYFEFVYKDGRFERTENYKIRKEADIHFTPEQQKMYDEALREYNIERYLYPEDRNPGVNIEYKNKIYGISAMEPGGNFEVYQYCRPDEDNESVEIIPDSANKTEVVSVSFKDGKAVINYVCPINTFGSRYYLGFSDIHDDGSFSFSADTFFDSYSTLFSDAAYRRIPLWRRSYFLYEKFFYLY